MGLGKPTNKTFGGPTLHHWLVVYLPLWKIWVSWDNYIPNIWKNRMFQTTKQSHYISHFMYIPISIYIYIFIFILIFISIYIYIYIYIPWIYQPDHLIIFQSSVRFPEDLLSRNTPDLLPEAPQISTTPKDAPQHRSRRKVGIQLGNLAGFLAFH